MALYTISDMGILMLSSDSGFMQQSEITRLSIKGNFPNIFDN